MPNDRTPDFIEYRLFEKDMGHGDIMVKNLNHIAGLVTAYNYVFGSKTEIAIENGELLTSSRKNGVYYVGITEYVDLNEVSITSSSGQEPNLQETNSLNYKNVSGYLDTNLITTMFSELLVEVGNYRKTHIELSRFLGLRPGKNLLKLDYMSTFMWTDHLNLHELTKILLLNLLFEYAHKFNQFDKLMEILINRITKSNQSFKYEDDYYIKDLLISAELDARFAEVFSVVYVKIIGNIHSEDGLGNLYSSIKLIKTEILNKENYSVYIFHDKFRENMNSLSYLGTSQLMMPEYVLLSSERCTNSQLGNYVIKKFDDLLTHPMFNKNEPSDKMLKHMTHQTLRISAFKQSFCYTILPVPYNLYGIYDDIESYQILDNYDDADDCCEIVSINETYMDNVKPQIQENEVGIFKFIEAGTSYKMLHFPITTFNLPVEKINHNRFRVYIDAKIDLTQVSHSVPGYITTSRGTASNLGFKSIDVGYNSNHHKREVHNTQLARETVSILTTWMMQDGYLNIVTDTSIELQIGQFITIRNSTNNSVLNGTHRISEVSNNSFVINFRVPVNMTMADMQNTTAEFDMLTFTKIYCNVEGLVVGDELVFDYASGNGKTFPIVGVSQDDAGVYALIDGVLDHEPSFVIKSGYDIEPENHVIFTHEGRSTYYEVTNTDILKESLWLSHLPDSTDEGRFGNTVSFIEIFINDI